MLQLTGIANSKDTLFILTQYKYRTLNKALVSNKCFDVGKSYLISFNEEDYEVSGDTLIVDVKEKKEIDYFDSETILKL